MNCELSYPRASPWFNLVTIYHNRNWQRCQSDVYGASYWLRSLSVGECILISRACHPWRDCIDFDLPQSRHPVEPFDPQEAALLVGCADRVTAFWVRVLAIHGATMSTSINPSLAIPGKSFGPQEASLLVGCAERASPFQSPPRSLRVHLGDSVSLFSSSPGECRVSGRGVSSCRGRGPACLRCCRTRRRFRARAGFR